jgi:hypothetical protein
VLNQESPIIVRTPPASPPPKIDHSLHSPFISVKQPSTTTRKEISSPPPVLLLPPSAFQISETKMPLSSRRIPENKISIPHRPHSTQPSTNVFINKDNLLDVKQRLETYLANKAKLK